MNSIRSLTGWFSLFFMAVGIVGCADDVPPVDLNVTKLADYSGGVGQASVKLYMYSGEAKLEEIKAFAEKQGCNMLFGYYYSDTVSLNEIPVEEVRTAKSFAAARNILFEGEGYARWNFSSQCLAVIPIVKDCNERFSGQNCR